MKQESNFICLLYKLPATKSNNSFSQLIRNTDELKEQKSSNNIRAIFSKLQRKIAQLIK